MPWWPPHTSCAAKVMTSRERAVFCAPLSVLQPALMQQTRLQLFCRAKWRWLRPCLSNRCQCSTKRQLWCPGPQTYRLLLPQTILLENHQELSVRSLLLDLYRVLHFADKGCISWPIASLLAQATAKAKLTRINTGIRWCSCVSKLCYKLRPEPDC